MKPDATVETGAGIMGQVAPTFRIAFECSPPPAARPRAPPSPINEHRPSFRAGVPFLAPLASCRLTAASTEPKQDEAK